MSISDEPSEEMQASRFGWFSAGVLSALCIMAAFFFLGDYLFSSADVAASTSDQIIEAQ